MNIVRQVVAVSGGVLLLGCESALEPAAGAGPELEPDGSVSETPSRVVASATGAAHRIRGADDQVWVLSFQALQHEDGSASGSFHTDVKHLGITADVDVTCMAVEGNAAFIAGVIRRATSPPRPDGTPLVREGTVAYFWTVDNGEGAGVVDQVSGMRLNDAPGEDQVFCGLRPREFLFLAPVELGNVQVRGG